MESQESLVAVVRSDRRRAAVGQALALIRDEIRSVVRPSTLLKINLVSHRRQLPSTHRDALSATLDALLSAGANEVVIAEGATDASAGFDRFGLEAEAWSRPVRFFDINRQETAWEPLELRKGDGSPLTARISRTVVEAECRVSLALMKTHVTSMVTFALKNMLSSLHPADRPMMHGNPGGGNGFNGWRRLAVEFLKGDSTLVNILTRTMGRARNVRNAFKDFSTADRLGAADSRFLGSVATLNANLATLADAARPHLAVLDGFDAMHREGPRHGTPIRLGLAVAGTDPVAVDAVATALMGFDPRGVGYLNLAEKLGLGTADLDRIKIVGDPIAKVRRRCTPHSNAAVARLAADANSFEAIPRPHLALGSKVVQR